MILSTKDKEIIVNILLLFVLPLIVYGLVLWNNKVTQKYLASLELTEEGKKEIERLEAEYEEKFGELNVLNYTD